MWGTVQNSTLRIHRKSQNVPSNNCVLSITSFIYLIFLSHCIVARLSTSSQIDTFFSRADGHCYSFIYDYRFQEAKRKFRKHGKWTLFRLVCYVTILAGRQTRLMLCVFCVEIWRKITQPNTWMYIIVSLKWGKNNTCGVKTQVSKRINLANGVPNVERQYNSCRCLSI